MPWVEDELNSLMAAAPEGAAQPASAPREAPGTLDTLAAAWRQNSSVSTLYERFANEQSLPFQKNFAIPRQEGYDPYDDVTDFADDPEALRALMRAESPEELQFLKNRVRQERSDRQTIADAGGWGLASALAAGITDPILLASMAIPLAPGIAGVGRVGRVGAGVAATAAVDTAAEAVLHSGQELRTVGESAFNVGAGVLLSSVLGGIATRVPKGDLDGARRALQEEIARANGVELPPRVDLPAAAAVETVEDVERAADELILATRADDLAQAGDAPALARPQLRTTVKEAETTLARLRGEVDEGLEERIFERMAAEDVAIMGEEVGNKANTKLRLRAAQAEARRARVQQASAIADAEAAVKKAKDDLARFEKADKARKRLKADPAIRDVEGKIDLVGDDELRDILKGRLATARANASRPPPAAPTPGAPVAAAGDMPINQAAEGADSFGAARAVDTSLEDEGIARGGQTIARTLGRISPLTRTLQSPFKSARVLAQKLVDVPYLLTKNLRGKATPASVERAVKRLVNLGRYHAVKVLDESFLEYKRSGGTLGRKQFSQEVSTALTRADVSPIPQVAKAVSWARKTFNDDKALFKDLGVEFGDDVVGAPSYFPRVYAFERIINNRADFNRRLANWFQQNPKMKVTKNADGSETVEPIILEAAEIQDAVMKTVDRILGLPTSRADLNLRSKGAPMKERSLDVPDEILAPYLERDFEMVMGGYFRAVAPEIEMRRMGLSSPALESELGELTDEYHRLLAKHVDDNKKTQELTSAYEQSMNDLMLLRDRLMGNVGVKGGKNIAWVRAARIARTYNYVRLLGAQMLSSMSDYGRLISRYGLTKTVAGTAKFLGDWHLNKLTRESAHRFGTALEMVLDSRTQTLADIGEELPRTRFDQGMQWASNQFSRVSLMSPWNATMKSLATLLEQHEIARAITRQSKFDLARLSTAGLDEADRAAAKAMIAQHAETVDGITRLRTELWADQNLARKVEDSITKVADEMIVTKGMGDLPRFMDDETWKTLLQFRSFAMASVNRTMIPLAQGAVNGDLARTAQGVGSMLTLGMLVYYAKEFAAGREPNLEPDRLVAEAFNWSGLMGFFPDLWDPIAAYSPEDEEGENLLPRFSRFKSRSPMESLLGPTFGTGLDTVLGSLSGFADGTLEQKDVERFRRLLPAQNLFYIRRLFNAIEGEVGEAIGAEGATTQDFTDRLTDEVPTK
jgi:hypothetical protein